MTAHGKRTCTVVSLVLVAVFVLSSISAYLFYLDLKKTFLARLSAEASSLVGQQVNIGDISFSPASVINIYTMQIQNPQGFAPGQLLKIKKIALTMNIRELIRGKLHFRNIVLHSPVLAVMKDPEGRLNISEGLKQFMTRRGTLAYQVDEFRILSGMADFNNDDRFRVDRISLILKDLSSSPGRKTSIEGDALWSGKNKVYLHGWANLKDDPNKFNFSVSAEDLSLSPFKMILEKYKIDADKTRMGLVIEAEGDTGKGVNLNSKITIRSPGYDFYKKDLLTIHLNTSAFYDISADEVTVNTLSVRVGDGSALNVKGRFLSLHETPSYDLVLKLDNFDLSAFNIARSHRITGLLLSDAVQIKGRFDRSTPEVNGSIQMKEGSFASDAVRLSKVNGSMVFSSAEKFSVRGEASAEILNAGTYSLSRPAAVRLSLYAKGRLQNMALSADIKTVPIMLKLRDDKELSLRDLHVSLEGMLKGNTFSGKSTAIAEGVRYDAYALNKMKCGLEFNYRQKNIALNNLHVETDIFSLSAGNVKVAMTGEKGGLVIETTDLSAAYPLKQAAFRGVQVSGKLNAAADKLSGDMTYSVASATFGAVKAERISGSAALNEGEFSLVISQAEFAGGRIRAFAQGKAPDQVFPVKAELTAEHIDVGVLSLAAEKFLDTGYRISGDLKSAGFKGTIDSKVSLHGEATMDVQKFAVLNTKTKRYLLKGVSVQPAVTMQGRDLMFKTAASSGSVSATASGTVKGFLEKERSYHIQGHLKETPVTDLRNSFWDVFPDSLLYAGLEGTISSDITVNSAKNTIAVTGSVRLKDFLLEGENGEYMVGPVNGAVPFAFGQGTDREKTLRLPAFETLEFDRIRRYYADSYPGEDVSRVTIGSLRYGYRLMNEITLWMKQDGGVLNVERFNAKMFGGSLDGSAVVDMSDGVQYRTGMILQGLSLSKLCDDIEPITGYISGKVNGVALLKGTGTDRAEIAGRADLWTYATRDEQTRISREFLQKIGGPSIKSYLGNRNFDKGIMSVYIQKGFLIFRELEISNRNFIGIQDLSVKVAPLSNRIALDHLMWTIVEAANRGAKK